MNLADLRAGVRHTWALDRAGLLTVAAFTAVYTAAVLIAGAPWWLILGVVVVAGAAVAYKVYQRARDYREALLFFDYMNEQASAQ